MSQPLLEIDELGKAYPTPQGEAVIVRNFNLKIFPGEFVCLLGHSGCGKSTVLSIAMGLSEPTKGGIWLSGREIEGPGLDRGVVFQSACLFPWLTVLENVLLATEQRFPKMKKAEQRDQAARHLAAVGLEGEDSRYPNELSAGMRQRAGIARAFALDPKALLLDEPFSLLDALTRLELQDELTRVWQEDRKTVLMVTHDVDEALFLADRIVMMTPGPAAGVGKIITVPFTRPRDRLSVLQDRDYYWMRDRLTRFLEEPRSSFSDDEWERVRVIPSSSP